MTSLKKTVMKQGMKLITDPRVMKLMQDERVMKAVMQVMSVPGRIQSFTTEHTEKIAKMMALATEDDVKDLKRTVRRLEEEVSRLQTDASHENRNGGASVKSNEVDHVSPKHDPAKADRPTATRR